MEKLDDVMLDRISGGQTDITNGLEWVDLLRDGICRKCGHAYISRKTDSLYCCPLCGEEYRKV